MKRQNQSSLIAALGAVVIVAIAGGASAAVCAAGAYHAGCAGPNGAVVVHKPVGVTCASGVYRAGCVGPNGAVAVAKPYHAGAVVAPVAHCRYVNGRRICG